MKLPISKYFAWSCVIVASIATGALLSVLGLAICDHNVGEHGASYSAYQYEWLALPAAPGMIVAEAREGIDFRLGEIQYHRASVIGWNMFIYGAAGFVAMLLADFSCERTKADTSTAINNKPNKAEMATPRNPSD